MEQQHGHLRVTPPHGEMQRGVAVLVRVIHAGLVRVQKASHAIEVSSGAGNVQGRLTLLEYLQRIIKLIRSSNIILGGEKCDSLTHLVLD